MAEQKKKVILFDLDGTLWDSTEAAAQIWSEVAAGYPQITEGITGLKLKHLYGLPLEEIAGKLFPSVPEELALQVMEECVRVQCPILAQGGGRLLGNVEAVFREIRSRYKIMIVSNCKSGYIEAFLEAHQLAGLVDDFTCPGETGKLKADNIRLICRRNQIELSEAVYVGDTVSDELAAHEAGVPFIYAAYGFGTSEHYEYRLEKLEALPLLLTELEKNIIS